MTGVEERQAITEAGITTTPDSGENYKNPNGEFYSHDSDLRRAKIAGYY